MKNLLCLVTLVIVCAASFPGPLSPLRAGEKKVQVYVLAGQSNMEGHGQLRSLDHLGDHPRYGHLLEKLKSDDGAWAVRDDVTIAWAAKERRHGPLTIGWGAGEQEIGPELMLGTILGDAHEAPVLLIKTAWGGKDVFCDFRSPGAGEPSRDETKLLERQRADGTTRESGAYYRQMVAEIKECLAHIEEVVPRYEGQGYELAGVAWFQGWNDFCQWHVQVEGQPIGMGIIERYPHNLAALIRDLRKDLGAPELPFVIGELGVGGEKVAEKAGSKDDAEAQALVAFRRAQRAVAADRSLKNVTFVPTADYWDDRLQELRELSDAYWEEKQRSGVPDTDENHLPTKELNDEYLRLGGHWYAHYNGSAANYCLVGYGLAMALLGSTPPEDPAQTTPSPDPAPGARFDPVEREIEGWKVHVEPGLTQGEHREEGERALAMLANHLQRIEILIPSAALAKLQAVEIWIERDHPKLHAMQYHPSRDWLVENGHDPRLARKVHITQARELLSREQMLKHPAVILHELAHGYHDQVLGFDNPEIVAVFEKAREKGIYDSVLLYTGERVRHYGLTNHKEYFAEGTEAYFYRNDFYPFVRAELKIHDPDLHDLLSRVWGGSP